MVLLTLFDAIRRTNGFLVNGTIRLVLLARFRLDRLHTIPVLVAARDYMNDGVSGELVAEAGTRGVVRFRHFMPPFRF